MRKFWHLLVKLVRISFAKLRQQSLGKYSSIQSHTASKKYIRYYNSKFHPNKQRQSIKSNYLSFQSSPLKNNKTTYKMKESLINNSISFMNDHTQFPRQHKLTHMKQSKKTSHNPIFNKLNKIFVQSKSEFQSRLDSFSFVPLVSSVKIGNQGQGQNENVSLKGKVIENKDILITAETQPSCVFLHTNPSSIFSKTNTHLFNPNNMENKENDPFATDNVPKELNNFLKMKAYQLPNNIGIDFRNQSIKSSNNLFKLQNNQKYFYENHKLKRLDKPHIIKPSWKIFEQHEQNQQKSTQQLPSQQYLQQSYTHPQPSQSSSQRIHQLQQKVQYYEKMQEFYLSQIETYRQEKQTLEWKLKLIVDELLFLTMKDKFKGSGMKASKEMSFIKQSKELLMSKINKFNFSQHINDIITENKENLAIGSNLQMDSQNLCLPNLHKLHLGVSPSLPKRPRQAFDLETSSQYISSFVLENVTLVESQDEDNDGDECKRRPLRQRSLDFQSSYDLGEPQYLAFT